MPFAAIDAHFGLELGPKDDLESLLYTLVYLRKGDIPWIVEVPENQKKNDVVIDIKMNIDPRQIFEGVPASLLNAYNYVRSLSFHDVPDYAYIARLLRNVSKPGVT